ncbi:hypothetical protein VSDG_08871 [Cytospora chrysosperma]|uniref:Fungal N-terminal domain-containing protein n=1 Tax=Cytospora chrysosperma TaxID=252740 RepID=A0A423VDP7_CYTCH|nr:hypothetical protein VSDG_08871 [Valsa sordida]
MDPATRFNSIIGSACVALMSSVRETLADVTNFIRRCRSARADLAAVTRELSELQMVLELLNDYGDSRAYAVPVELQSHLRPILTNCTTVVLRISGVLRRLGEGAGPPKWTLEGKKEVNDLQDSLEVHRGALGLVSDLITICIARATRNQGSREPQGEQLQVHEVADGLQAVMSSILVSDSNATLAREHFALQVHLGQIIAYAQTLNLNGTDAWEEALKSIDATQGHLNAAASAATPEPISPMASIRGRASSYDGDGAATCNSPHYTYTVSEPVSPMESRDMLTVSSYEDEEITEEALAFAQVPVHIMGRLSLNLVGHVYTNNSGASGGSDGTSFQKSFSSIATAEEQGEEEAEDYAHSTATSDTGSLRDGHLQFSQMDVTQISTQESQSSESSQNDRGHSKLVETVKVSVDDEPVELSLWDIRGIDYDPSWLNDTQVALVCFSVNIGSTDAKGKHLGRWVTEVNRNCPTAAIILVGLKSDLRWHARTIEKLRKHGKTLVTLEQGEQLRESIGAVRYVECSARTGDGVFDVLEETTRTALRVKNEDYKRPHRRPLSRIGKFLGLGHRVSDSEGG